MSSEAILLDSISKSFANEEVLENIDLTVEEGEFCVVIGPSGCGKSTLLKCIAGLVGFEAGNLRLRGQDASDTSVKERELGFVFQEFEETLFPHKTVQDNVAFGLEQKETEFTDEEIEQRVGEMLELLSISETKEDLPSELSGGQQQRVEVARQFVRECDIMLLDDPLADLDYKLQKHMELELRRLHERLGSTFIYVTHNQDQALKLADKLVVMNQGAIEQSGTPDEIYAEPKSAFVGRFVGDSNPFVASVVEDGEGEKVVETEIGRMHVTGANDGEVPPESLVIVRPENVEIGDESLDNVVHGFVNGTTYTGEETEISVKIEGLDRDLQAIAPGRADVGDPGTEITIGWDAENALYFEDLSVNSTVTITDLLEI